MDWRSPARFLDDVPCALQHRTAPCGVRRMRAVIAQNDRGGREVRARDDREQLFARYRRVFHEGQATIDHLAKIVRRNIRRHADSDAARAVDQQVGEPGWQNRGLAARPIVIVGKIDGILVEIIEQAVGDTCQSRFGIAHASGGVWIDTAEIALAIDQRHPHRPILRHPRQRVVDRAVPVRVIIAHHVANDLGALAISSSGDEAAFLAGEQNTAMNRLQAIAHIGQRAADDHAHRIIEIAGFHLIDDVDASVVFTARCRRFHQVSIVAQFRCVSEVAGQCPG